MKIYLGYVPGNRASEALMAQGLLYRVSGNKCGDAGGDKEYTLSDKLKTIRIKNEFFYF